jgi:hypothetical protein
MNETNAREKGMGRLLAALVLVGLLGLAAPAHAGDILDASCPCGYHKERLFLYGGRANFKTICLFPALCKTSREITLINVLDPRRDPRDCKASDALSYEHPSLAPTEPGKSMSYWRLSNERTVTIYEGGYVCPRCGQRTLRFKHAGNWD